PRIHASVQPARLPAVAQLLARGDDRHIARRRQDRTGHRHGPRGRRTARAAAARSSGHDQEEGSGGHDQEKGSGPMTTPAAPSHLADLLSARDSSLPLAAAALARVGDAHGRAPFPELAAAYREEVPTLRAPSRGAAPPEPGAQSSEASRTS